MIGSERRASVVLTLANKGVRKHQRASAALHVEQSPKIQQPVDTKHSS